jgi:hypothetical protein
MKTRFADALKSTLERDRSIPLRHQCKRLPGRISFDHKLGEQEHDLS